MTLFKKKQNNKVLVASLVGQQCRIQLFDCQTNPISQTFAAQFLFTDLEHLADEFIASTRKHASKNTLCRWMLSADHYQSYSVDAPNVSNNEMREALKWQIKELLDKPVDEMLISHYRPNHPDASYDQINAVAVEKKLVESLIDTTARAGFTLDAIEIEELCIGNALIDQLEDKVVGFVGENHAGLIFNFYHQNELCFSRYKKGRYIPKQPSEQELVLGDEQQAQEDSFLLETQRTLDYVVSQIFRRPLDCIFLQKTNTNEKLAETMSQLTDIPVIWADLGIAANADSPFPPSLAEAGCAKRVSE